MTAKARPFRFSGVATLGLLVGAIVVALPTDIAAQNGPPHTPPGRRLKHDLATPPGKKHDIPPGQACKGNRSAPWCPPGQALKHDLQVPSLANAVVEGFAPSELMVQLINEAGEAALPTSAPVPPKAQHHLYWVVVQSAPPELTGLAGALGSGDNAQAWSEAVQLVGAIQDLVGGDAYLPGATEAFNAFLDASSDAFLEDPAPEFVVVHAFLGALVDEAFETELGSGS